MSFTHADAPVEFSLVEVADGVFGYIQPDGSWMINNTGFIVAKGGVTAIDASSTERRTRNFLSAIGSVTADLIAAIADRGLLLGAVMSIRRGSATGTCGLPGLTLRLAKLGRPYEGVRAAAEMAIHQIRRCLALDAVDYPD